MATVIAFGRVGGKASYQYGPKSFNEDWNGAFTALQITSLLTKLPKAKLPMSRHTAPRLRSVGRAAQALKKELLVEDLKSLTLEIEHILITKEATHRLWPSELSSKFLSFSTAPEEPIVLLTGCLLAMGLSTWGVLSQICFALTRFSEQRQNDSGHLCINICFAI